MDGQTKFEEGITDMLDRQLKGVVVVRQQVQKFHKEVGSELVTQ
jgi:hypothetical protein